jgi:hypothetical protein
MSDSLVRLQSLLLFVFLSGRVIVESNLIRTPSLIVAIPMYVCMYRYVSTLFLNTCTPTNQPPRVAVQSVLLCSLTHSLAHSAEGRKEGRRIARSHPASQPATSSPPPAHPLSCTNHQTTLCIARPDLTIIRRPWRPPRLLRRARSRTRTLAAWASRRSRTLGCRPSPSSASASWCWRVR